ncbi:MAG: hypothetical protein LBU30_00895 [Candidatus Methanoplasma sp.]|jgi:hypothetical protein|nr:hypothetical protein [Candidatus Methanoplasma sp.]
MAKKKRRIIEEKEEEYEFVPSEFDEREFILKDVYGTKVLFVITILAVAVGIIGALLCAVSDSGWMIATAVAFVIVLAMKKLLLLLGFRVDLLELKTMLADYLLFLMLALGVCIVFINAPFM